MTISNLWNFEQYSLEFGPAKPDLQQPSWPHVKFKKKKKKCPKYFSFQPLILLGSFQKMGNQLNFIPFSMVHYYTQFNQKLWVNDGSNP